MSPEIHNPAGGLPQLRDPKTKPSRVPLYGLGAVAIGLTVVFTIQAVQHYRHPRLPEPQLTRGMELSLRFESAQRIRDTLNCQVTQEHQSLQSWDCPAAGVFAYADVWTENNAQLIRISVKAPFQGKLADIRIGDSPAEAIASVKKRISPAHDWEFQINHSGISWNMYGEPQACHGMLDAQKYQFEVSWDLDSSGKITSIDETDHSYCIDLVSSLH
ncbi:MAG: hypothetical protein ABSG84_15965 [Acidobacteriaceae bacterium]